MRCSKCRAKVKFVGGGHGSSESPASYFWPGLVALIAAIACFGLGHTWAGSVGLLFALPLLGWSLVASREGYGNRCTACDHVERSFPWSA